MNARYAVPTILLLAASAGFGISTQPAEKLCARYFDSDKVYVGEVLEVGYFPPSGDDLDVNYVKYKVSVIKTFRGSPGETEIVLSENASGRWCAEVGKRYVVFSRRGMVGGCGGRLDQPEFVQQVGDEVAALSGLTSATIEGEVVRSTSDRGLQPVGAGTEVRLFGMTTTLTTKTDARGEFSFTVPAGLYCVSVSGARSSDYSRRADEPFQVVEGQCAQFQFQLEE